jgi:TolB-like protein
MEVCLRDRQLRCFFEEYAFDTDRRELHRGANLVSITPQVFDLLNYLILNRERVVSKDDLISAIWNGRIVSDAALTTRLNAARAAIGDSGDKQRLIKTMPRRGFRFVGTVHEAQGPATVSASSAAQNDDRAQRSLSPPPLSIVVLPFANLSGDPENDYFVDGVTESLTADLSRISGSFVIGRHTAFSYKGKPIDLKQIGRELHICYVLEGSVQRGGNRLRVNVQLLDAQTGNHLWAERFEKHVTDLFEMQDEIVARLANTLNAQLVAAEARRAERLPDPDTMDLVFQGKAWLNKGLTPEHMTRAAGFFQRALAINPENLEALVGTAQVDAARGASLLTDDRAARCSAAETILTRVLSLAPDHAAAHLILGFVYIVTNRATQGISECEHSLALNRNLAGAHAAIGFGKFFMGRASETEAHILEAFRLSPRDIFAHRWMHTVGSAKIQLGLYAEAVDWLRRSVEANRNFPIAHFWLAAALGLLGAVDEARIAARTGLAQDPDFTIRRLRAVRSSDNAAVLAGRDRLCEGMRLAGILEG